MTLAGKIAAAIVGGACAVCWAGLSALLLPFMAVRWGCALVIENCEVALDWLAVGVAAAFDADDWEGRP